MRKEASLFDSSLLRCLVGWKPWKSGVLQYSPWWLLDPDNFEEWTSSEVNTDNLGTVETTCALGTILVSGHAFSCLGTALCSNVASFSNNLSCMLVSPAMSRHAVAVLSKECEHWYPKP